MKFTIVAVLAIALMSPLEASESDESDYSATTLSYKDHRKNAGRGKRLKPLNSKNIQEFFEYFQHEPKPQALIGKLGRENTHRSMNAEVPRHAPKSEELAAPKPKPNVVAKVDVSMNSLKYQKVLNVNK